MKKTTKIKYGKYALQELIIPGSKTYYQIVKGKEKLARFLDEKEAAGNFDHIVMHGALPKQESAKIIKNGVIEEDNFKTYASPDGYDVIVYGDEFEIYKDGELVLDGEAPTEDPKKIYQIAKRSGKLNY